MKTVNHQRTTTAPWASVLYAPGTNCEEETMAAIRLAGGDPHLVFLDDIRFGRTRITDCDLFIDPGGFSFGDHLETGVATATFLQDHWPLLRQARKPTFGICNGKQIIVRGGLFGPGIVMIQNRSRVFCSRPIQHRVIPSHCLWTKGHQGEVWTFEAAHGYGLVYANQESRLYVAMVYEGLSPNGGEIAMITDATGEVAAMMNHPERPWDNLDGQKIFRAGINVVR